MSNLHEQIVEYLRMAFDHVVDGYYFPGNTFEQYIDEVAARILTFKED